MEYVKMESNHSEITLVFEDPELTITFPIRHPDASHAKLSRNDLGLTEKDISVLISTGLAMEVF